ncbi:hypothetical protein [Coleofasciculus sp. H7-2]
MGLHARPAAKFVIGSR